MLYAGVAAAALLVATLAALSLPFRGPAPLEPFPAPERVITTAGATFDDFAGASSCAECHAAEHAAWRRSTHGRAGGDPRDRPPARRFDGQPIRFADAEVIPRTRSDGALEFVVRRAARSDEVLTVDAVVGGAAMYGGGTQGYLTRREDGTVRLLPWEQTSEGTWFCNTGTRADRGWQPITPDLRLADCGDWPPRRVLGSHGSLAGCQQCHGSQIETVHSPDGRRETRWQDLAVDCEACHGPARRHAEQARAGVVEPPADLALLDSEASVRLCLRCHALKDELEPGWLQGRDFDAHYSTGLPALSEEGLFPDGRTRSFAYQEGHLYSACYLRGGMTCVDCHAPHEQTYRSFRRRPLPGRFDDGQCLGCHPAKAAEPSAHTMHAAASAGSRCVACHMPFLQQPEVGDDVAYRRSDHTISIPRPALDAVIGVRGACAACHADRDDAQLAADVERLWGPVRPADPITAALTDAVPPPDAARLLANAERNPMAALTLLGRLLIHTGTAPTAGLDGATRDALRRVTGLADPDLAAAAAALLHFVEGDRRGTRRELIDLLAGHPRSDLLRSRWVTALGWLGDTLSAAGLPHRATLAWERALELEPRRAPLLRSLGYARLRFGAHRDAIDLFTRAVDIDPGDALNHIALGIARSAGGDDLAAGNAYRAALRADPYEPLAYFNLGNVELRAGRAAEAAELYRRAVALDPGMAAAHFNLARAELQLGRTDAAADALRDGLEFEPGNAAAADMFAQLRAARMQ